MIIALVVGCSRDEITNSLSDAAVIQPEPNLNDPHMPHFFRTGIGHRVHEVWLLDRVIIERLL